MLAHLGLAFALMLPTQAAAPSGVSFSGLIVSPHHVQWLRLMPLEPDISTSAVHIPVTPEGTFTIVGLKPAKYRVAVHPPLGPGAELLQIEVRDLTSGELSLYDAARVEEKLVATPGVTSTWRFGIGGSALLGTFGVGSSLSRTNPSGGANADFRARDLILEVRVREASGPAAREGSQ